MTLKNLYNVTKTLTELLRLNITRNIEESLDGDLEVTGIPPERVESGASYRLNFFLYHIAEDAYYKNALGPGSDVPNVAKTPMALNLFYILTVHHEVGGDEPQFDAAQQQRLMGYALKTFHDFPVITDQTRIDDGTPTGPLVLDSELRGKNNRLEVILRPVPAEDAIAFWGSEETRTVRLSAYYEVRVVMLEPEPPKTMPGIVLNLGTYLVQTGSPHLSSGQSLVRFQLPAHNGGTTQQVKSSPARVTLNSLPSPPEAHNRLQLLGTNLNVGQSRSLILKNSIWSNPPSPVTLGDPADPPIEPVKQVEVDLGINPEWAAAFTSDRITVTLAPTLNYRQPDAAPGDPPVVLPMLPGFYSVLVRSILNEQVITGELKQITATSNEIGFAIAPRIENHDDPDGGGNIQINLGSEFNPLTQNLPEKSIQVIVAGEVYKSTGTDPPAEEGEFFVGRDTTVLPPLNFIRINPHFSVSVTEAIAYPLRLIVNGAESAPFWIELSP